MNELLTIAGALNALDVNNDEHWTKTGLPKLKALKEMTGNDELSMSEVNNLLPEGFNRTNAAAAPTFIDPPEGGPDDGATGDGGDEAEEPDAIAMLEAACAACQTDRYRRNNELQGIVRAYQTSQHAIRDLQGRLDLRSEAKAKANAEANAALAEAEE